MDYVYTGVKGNIISKNCIMNIFYHDIHSS